ncbi:hypothetical protein SEUCBS140593_010525 [Sporothrix eucalyptigena]|uniref:Fido domain-containing protein n=1 Tax=Sporothrix eucalyptigena TaxID=1812306 RepID=A0ABP0D1L5_9PEZI
MEQDLAETLVEIDNVREKMARPVSAVVKTMNLVAACAHQSVMIENNTLPASNSLDMYDELTSGLFSHIDLRSLSIQELAKVPLLRLESFLPDKDETDFMELRNHIVACQWIADTAASRAQTFEAGFTEDQVRALSMLAMTSLDSRGLYPWAIGPRVRLGQYRQVPIGVKSNPMAVFPYHLEVLACMQRFFEWRARAYGEKKLHPLIQACHAMVYFLQIHPFVDGNGRVSRMIMQDDLMRQGYFPGYLFNLDRVEYLTMIRNAADGNPSLLANRVVTAQLEFMLSNMLEEAAEAAQNRK